MKYICLSFDDARSDTYETAFPIMKKYGIKATVNVISDYVLHQQNYHFHSAPRAMTKEQIVKWQNEGFEIACHGNTHQNTAQDVIENLEQLKSFGVNIKDIGFASPNSSLTVDNIAETGIQELKRNGTISYIRSGIQIRREGVLYTIGASIERLTHSKYLFQILNKRNYIMPLNPPELLPSTAIKDYTTVEQLKYFIESMRGGAVILMFHSILPKTSPQYGSDHYYWDEDKFNEFCKFVSQNQDMKVITTRELVLGGRYGKQSND